MKKTLLKVGGAVALFAGGWIAGSIRGQGPDAPVGPRVLPRMQEAATGAGAPSRDAGRGTEGARAFVPGRPFPRGGAREWVLGLTPGLKGDRRSGYVSYVRYLQMFATMDAESVREAMAAIEELTAIEDARNPQRRSNPNGDGVLDVLMEFAITRLAQLSPDEGMEALKKNFNLNDGSTQFLVMGMLAASDPAGAEQKAAALPDEQRRDAMKALLAGWMSKGPAEALAFADRHPDTIHDKEREKIFESWVKSDPAPAIKAAVEATTKTGNTELLRNTVEEWSKVDAEGAAKWAASYTGTGSVTAKAMVLERRLGGNPEAAVAEYAQLQQACSDPKELTRLTSALADGWSRKDVNAARTWAESLPAGDLHDHAMAQVAEEWVKRDAPAASEWLRTQPPGDLRDGAASHLAGAISSSDPAGAFEWARNISNEDQRRRTLENVLQQWRGQDPQAAREALESLPLPLREKLR